MTHCRGFIFAIHTVPLHWGVNFHQLSLLPLPKACFVKTFDDGVLHNTFMTKETYVLLLTSNCCQHDRQHVRQLVRHIEGREQKGPPRPRGVPTSCKQKAAKAYWNHDNTKNEEPSESVNGPRKMSKPLGLITKNVKSINKYLGFTMMTRKCTHKM